MTHATTPTVLTVPGRFNGPPSSGNGGWTAGALADLSGLATPHSAVTVQLRTPPPLDVAMRLETVGTGPDDGWVVAVHDGATVVRARIADAPPEPVEAVAADKARAAEASYAGLTSHPFPGCFACGTDRAEGDGLRIFPGRVGDLDGPDGPQARVAATWTPTGSDAADTATTWAALDCIGGWAGDLEERMMVLGSMTAVVTRPPVVGEEHVVVGAGRRTDGRRTFTAATLYDAAGDLVATAEHTWFAVDPKDFA